MNEFQQLVQQLVKLNPRVCHRLQPPDAQSLEELFFVPGKGAIPGWIMATATPTPFELSFLVAAIERDVADRDWGISLIELEGSNESERYCATWRRLAQAEKPNESVQWRVCIYYSDDEERRGEAVAGAKIIALLRAYCQCLQAIADELSPVEKVGHAFLFTAE